MLRLAGFSITLALAIMLAGCGGSNSSQFTPGIIQGQAVKGILHNAQVAAYAIRDGQVDSTALASTTTDITGNYSLPLSDWSGPVLLILSTTANTLMQCELSLGCSESESDNNGGNSQVAMGEFFNFHQASFQLKAYMASADDFQLITPISDMAAARIEQQAVFSADDIRQQNQQARLYFDLPPEAEMLPGFAGLLSAQADQAREMALMAAFARAAAEQELSLSVYLQQMKNDFSADGQLPADSDDGHSIAELSEAAMQILPTNHAATNRLQQMRDQARQSDSTNWNGDATRVTSRSAVNQVRDSSSNLKQSIAEQLQQGSQAEDQRQADWREKMQPLTGAEQQASLLLQLLAAVSSVDLVNNAVTVNLADLLTSLGLPNASADGTITAAVAGDNTRLIINGSITVSGSTTNIEMSLLGDSLQALQDGIGNWQLEQSENINNQLTTNDLSVVFDSGDLTFIASGQYQMSAQATISQLGQQNPLSWSGGWNLKVQSDQGNLLADSQLISRLDSLPAIEDLLGATDSLPLGVWDKFSGLQLDGELLQGSQSIFNGDFALLKMSLETEGVVTQQASLNYLELTPAAGQSVENYFIQVTKGADRLTASELDFAATNGSTLEASLQISAQKVSDSWKSNAFSINGQLVLPNAQLDIQGNATLSSQLSPQDSQQMVQMIDHLNLDITLSMAGIDALTLEAEQAAYGEALSLSALVRIGFLIIRINI
ncbi:hypothetical protein [Pelagibaculum spongiae]|nr:hypothetical protein [Pelagibaculum spongiae]